MTKLIIDGASFEVSDLRHGENIAQFLTHPSNIDGIKAALSEPRDISFKSENFTMDIDGVKFVFGKAWGDTNNGDLTRVDLLRA